MFGKRRRHIGKGHRADRFDTEAIAQNRHLFTGVIRAGPGWVIAVIGGEYQKIARARPRVPRTDGPRYLFGSSFEIESRSSGPPLQLIFAVPTRLWMLASGQLYMYI